MGGFGAGVIALSNLQDNPLGFYIVGGIMITILVITLIYNIKHLIDWDK